ncbi:hypothetical protein QC826_15525 [Rugamonas sp. DEMB1]|nr:hypothetical protein [Rugamonas sp. DEMB1]WGG48154.1 hypothetical protein QC826_15525 [Rugamonas sp. DEMB1]
MTMSTRLTSSCGSRLVSVAPLTADGAARRPSISTSVRCAPRLRRLRKAPELGPVDDTLPLAGVVEPRNTGSIDKALAMVPGEAALSCSAVTTVTGVGASEPSRMVRVPLTSTTAMLPAALALAVAAFVLVLAAAPPSASPPGGAPWAPAALAAVANTTPMALPATTRNLVLKRESALRMLVSF